jgi:acetyl-CoA carboxylase carboxyltransferase component
MLTRLEELMEKKKEQLAGGGESRVEKQHAQGKLTARERLDLLFDPGTFVEMDAFATHRCTSFGMERQHLPGDGVVGGFGKVEGRIVYAYAQDFTVMGGSLGEVQANKICKLLENARKVGAPVVGMNDSGGARIQEGIDALAGYGKIFFRNTAASGVIPQITAIMGPCAGGAVYSPALTDFVFMVERTSKMFITGPDVIKTVTGEEVTAEALGGAAAHNRTSGCAHFMASNDQECIQKIRRLLSYLPSNCREEPPVQPCTDSPRRMLADAAALVPENPNKSYDMYEVIRRLVDQGEFMDYQAGFAPNIITCFARMDGRPVGIIANQPRALAGCLDINASDKAARFIRTCDAFGLPLLNLVDVPGFLPGVKQESGGIIRHGAKMLYAYSEATVPKVTLILRKAYGGAYLAMCCRELGADVVYAWPGAEVAVMGPDGAANIIFRGLPAEERAQKVQEYKAEFATPYKAAERGMVDDVIHPATTRQRICTALEMLRSKVRPAPEKRHGNIPL